MSDLTGVVGIVRSFNDPTIGKFVSSMLGYLPTVIVVVNAEVDKGLTRVTLERECGEVFGKRVHIVETVVKDGPRSWSALLNAGITFVKGMNAGGGKFEYVFNISNTTMFERGDVKKMRSYFENPRVGI